ncbi:LPXTG-motif cell wall anchor domain-containing protein [Streptococcus suis]|uniref:LPXTG-motif cell wall anchor domain-containing protein n=1 Tax=Streptococcus suis TaxID=1307 RepID=A0A0Z8U8H5_STRSU|nr:LPXTG-motif cell wall anchor domain-containing protein [Streptococcus suis]
MKSKKLWVYLLTPLLVLLGSGVFANSVKALANRVSGLYKNNRRYFKITES